MINHQNIRADIWLAIDHLSDDQINQRESSEHWSIAQILEHLYQIEDAITNKIKQVLQEEKTKKAVEKPIHYTLNRTKKIKSPHPVSEHYQTLSALKEKLDTSRFAFNKLIAPITPDQRKQKTMTHPLFGEGMNLDQWITFAALHEQRHLQQIEEVKKRLF